MTFLFARNAKFGVRFPSMHQSKETRHTLDDILALPDDSKAELLNGELIMMAPAAARHSVVSAKILRSLNWPRDKSAKYGGPDDPRTWIFATEAWTEYDDGNIFVHDIAAFAKQDLPSLPERGPIKAIPKWVCEVLSPSNWAHDTQRKRLILERYGVHWYWLVDPRQKSIQILELKHPNEHYQIAYAAELANGLLKLPPFETCPIDLGEIFEGI
jgi:Uma2 family endonuclease